MAARGASSGARFLPWSRRARRRPVPAVRQTGAAGRGGRAAARRVDAARAGGGGAWARGRADRKRARRVLAEKSPGQTARGALGGWMPWGRRPGDRAAARAGAWGWCLARPRRSRRRRLGGHPHPSPPIAGESGSAAAGPASARAGAAAARSRVTVVAARLLPVGPCRRGSAADPDVPVLCPLPRSGGGTSLVHSSFLFTTIFPEVVPRLRAGAEIRLELQHQFEGAGRKRNGQARLDQFSLVKLVQSPVGPEIALLGKFADQPRSRRLKAR